MSDFSAFLAVTDRFHSDTFNKLDSWDALTDLPLRSLYSQLILLNELFIFSHFEAVSVDSSDPKAMRRQKHTSNLLQLRKFTLEKLQELKESKFKSVRNFFNEENLKTSNLFTPELPFLPFENKPNLSGLSEEAEVSEILVERTSNILNFTNHNHAELNKKLTKQVAELETALFNIDGLKKRLHIFEAEHFKLKTENFELAQKLAEFESLKKELEYQHEARRVLEFELNRSNTILAEKSILAESANALKRAMTSPVITSEVPANDKQMQCSPILYSKFVQCDASLLVVDSLASDSILIEEEDKWISGKYQDASINCSSIDDLTINTSIFTVTIVSKDEKTPDNVTSTQFDAMKQQLGKLKQQATGSTSRSGSNNNRKKSIVVPSTVGKAVKLSSFKYLEISLDSDQKIPNLPSPQNPGQDSPPPVTPQKPRSLDITNRSVTTQTHFSTTGPARPTFRPAVVPKRVLRRPSSAVFMRLYTDAIKKLKCREQKIKEQEFTSFANKPDSISGNPTLPVKQQVTLHSLLQPLQALLYYKPKKLMVWRNMKKS
jgi:hypothetical protein